VENRSLYIFFQQQQQFFWNTLKEVMQFSNVFGPGAFLQLAVITGIGYSTAIGPRVQSPATAEPYSADGQMPFHSTDAMVRPSRLPDRTDAATRR
jgi:hypothetical protein